MRLKRNNPETYRKVISREIKPPSEMSEFVDPVVRALSLIRRMNKPDLKRLITRMTEEGLI
jgi:hypothetical protein